MMVGRIKAFLRPFRGDARRETLRRALARFDKFSVMQFGVRRLLIRYLVSHVSGPKTVSYAVDELIAVTVVRNGEVWADAFLEHHRGVGVKHFVVLDNGSTDATREIFTAQPDVTLLSTQAPYSAYENTMKRYLVERFCKGRWCLFVDIDELFDYPFADRMPLAGLLGYLDRRHFNAVVTQMLDMFSDAPINTLKSARGEPLKATYQYYDVTHVHRAPYPFGSVDEDVRMHSGGIRKAIFATNNGLTKISLFKVDGALRPFVQWHHAANARIADVSGLLLHYPFTSEFFEKVKDAVETGRYGYLTTDEYRGYHKVLNQTAGLTMRLPTAQRFEGVEPLLRDNFVVASQMFEAAALRSD